VAEPGDPPAAGERVPARQDAARVAVAIFRDPERSPKVTLPDAQRRACPAAGDLDGASASIAGDQAHPLSHGMSVSYRLQVLGTHR